MSVRTAAVQALIEETCPEEGIWGEHPDHEVSDWEYEVANGDTRLGYWEWVWARIDMGE